jgi:hypothetical protein
LTWQRDPLEGDAVLGAGGADGFTVTFLLSSVRRGP